MQRLYGLNDRVCAMARVMFTGLLMVQLVLGSVVHALRTELPDEPCCRTCQCRDMDDLDSRYDGKADSDKTEEDHCPPGCSGCVCCSGTALAVLSAPHLRPSTFLGEAMLPVPRQRPFDGTFVQVFRPPKRSHP